MRRIVHVVVCIALHVLFILLHVVLLALALLLKHPPIFATSLLILEPIWTVSVQSFTIIYCAGLVTTTQRLALQDVFHHSQTLSAIHDKSSAWLGLGSSVFAILRQRSLPTDRVGVIATLVYLLSICVIHTAFPSVFAVSEFWDTPSSWMEYCPTVLAYQNFKNVSQMGFNVYNFLNDYNTLNDSPAGLVNNALYDIFPSGIIGNSSVRGTEPLLNVTSFSVNCSYISGITLRGDNSVSPPGQGNFGGPIDVPFVMALGTNIMTKNVPLFPMLPHTLQMLPYPGIPDTVILASTYPVVDTDSKRSPFIKIEPSWNIQGNSSYAKNLSITESIQVQLMACEIRVNNGLYVNESLPSPPISPEPSLIETSPRNDTVWSKWTPFEHQSKSSDPMLNYIQEFVSRCPPSQNFSDTALSSGITNIELGGSGVLVSPYVPSILENFVWSDIVHTRSSTMPSCPCSTSLPFSVAELNFSLERAFAALVWSANNLTADDEKRHGLLSLIVDTESDDTNSSLRGCYISLNPTLIKISLVASCVTLLACILLVHRSQGFCAEVEVPFVDTSGVLPVVWLLGNESRLADIEEPDIEDLRKAGMFEIDSDVFNRFNSSVNRRTRNVKGYEGVESGEHDSE